MKNTKELRKELRLLSTEQAWLRGKMIEFKASLASNKDKMKQLKEEIKKSKPAPKTAPKTESKAAPKTS